MFFLCRLRSGFRITVTSWRNTLRNATQAVKQLNFHTLTQQNPRYRHLSSHLHTIIHHFFPQRVPYRLLSIQATPRGRIIIAHLLSGRPCFRSKENHHIAAGIARSGLIFRHPWREAGIHLAWVVANAKSTRPQPRDRNGKERKVRFVVVVKTLRLKLIKKKGRKQ